MEKFKIGNLIDDIKDVDYIIGGVQQIYFDKIFHSKEVRYTVERHARDKLKFELRRDKKNFHSIHRELYKKYH